ncbi:MAG: TlpA family protein disulfide reductase [Acidobacteria bacterium]|nr:TlpA family protein disulfide reductase [Acidobacteriota bacterium]
MKLLVFLLSAAGLAASQVVPEVRKLAQAGDLVAAQARVQQVRGFGPWTPELLVAHSWLGRGAQIHKQWDQAMAFSSETRRMSLDMLKGRRLDAEPNLPLALGASIEVNGHALANTGRRSEGVAFLREELKRWHDTSIRTRIQKNLHLLALEGQKAPPLETSLFVGSVKMKSLEELRGRPVLLFLWAHWCNDCKAQGPVIDAMRKEFPSLMVVAPTQRYGYVAGGEEASKEKETPYIAQVQKERYPWMDGLPMPISEENFRVYGVSSTPTLVLLDGKGIVRMYHPGQMTVDELRAVLAGLVP